MLKALLGWLGFVTGLAAPSVLLLSISNNWVRHSLTACNHRCCCGDDSDPKRGVHQPPALLGGEELHVDLAFGVNTSFGLTEYNSTPFSFNCLLIIEANASAKTVPMADSSSTAPTTVLN